VIGHIENLTTNLVAAQVYNSTQYLFIGWKFWQIRH